MDWLDLAKRLVPLDLGQGGRRSVTKGKLIARDLVPPPAAPGRRALDVGCREGEQSRWLEACGYAVTSIDLEKRCDRAEIVDADAPLPWADATFDLVWCSEVIEHLRDPAASIGEMRRVLAPGGAIVVTTPNSGAWFFRAAAAAGLRPSRLQNPAHRHFFTLADVRTLFPSAKLYGFFPYAIVKARIERGVGLLTPTFVVVERG